MQFILRPRTKKLLIKMYLLYGNALNFSGSFIKVLIEKKKVLIRDKLMILEREKEVKVSLNPGKHRSNSV